MGYWGYSPRQGDTPHDIFESAMQAPADRLLAKYFGPRKKYHDSHDKWEALGVFQLVIDADIPVKREYTGRAMKMLEECVGDESFVADFDDPRKMAKAARIFSADLVQSYERGR